VFCLLESAIADSSKHVGDAGKQGGGGDGESAWGVCPVVEFLLHQIGFFVDGFFVSTVGYDCSTCHRGRTGYCRTARLPAFST
jgi:hypothetical protein